MSYASIFRDGLFSDRVALVTGGGTGIGRRIARELARLGATVVLVARREEPLRDAAAEVRAEGGEADHLVADVRDAAAVEAAVAAAVERRGRIDLLVNNAGGQFPAAAADISPNGWRAVVDLNLNGTFLVTRAVYRASMREHGGAVVSVLANFRNGFPGMAHTGAARAGVANLTMTLAQEWAASRVRVNAVAPGVIASSGLETYGPQMREVVNRAAASSPAGRIGTEAEVSAAVAFLLSDAAAYITGVTLPVDGGASLYREPLVPLGRGAPAPYGE